MPRITVPSQDDLLALLRTFMSIVCAEHVLIHLYIYNAHVTVFSEDHVLALQGGEDS